MTENVETMTVETSSKISNVKNKKTKKQKKSKLLPILIMLLGVLFILYPVVATQWNNIIQIKVAKQYLNLAEKKYASNKSETKINQELEEAKIYNATRASGPILDPWLARISKDNEAYQEYLKQLNDLPAMGRIVIPSIKADMLIYHGTGEDSLQIGVGHLYGTDLPVGGENTHSVLTGHTGLSNATLFDNLINIKKGEYIYLSVAGQKLKYQVHEIRTVLPTNTSNLKKVKGQDLLTLITCTPYGINSHRLQVHAHRVPLQIPADNTIFSSLPTLHWQWWMIISLIASGFIIGMIFYWLFGGKRKNKDKENEQNKPVHNMTKKDHS